MAKNGYAYQGPLRRDVFFSPEQIDQYFRRPDGVFSDPAFLSTTTNPAGVFPGNTILRIEGKSGVSANALSEFAEEAEVLFKPGTKFSVTSVKSADGITIIEMNEIIR